MCAAPAASSAGASIEGNHASPCATARRRAAADPPPIQIGGGGTPGASVSSALLSSAVGAPAISARSTRRAASVRAARSPVGHADGIPGRGPAHRPAEADPEDHAPAGELLQGCYLLGRPGWVAQREDHHAEADVYACRGRGGRGQHERALGQRDRRGEVVADEHAVQADILHVPRDRGEVRRGEAHRVRDDHRACGAVVIARPAASCRASRAPRWPRAPRPRRPARTPAR